MFAAYPKSVAGPVEQKGGPCGRIVLRARLERPRRAGQERGQFDKVLGSSRGRRDSLLGRGRDGLMIEVWDREEPSDPGAADRLTGGGLQQQPELHGEQPRDSIRALSTIPRCRLARSCADGERWTARGLGRGAADARDLLGRTRHQAFQPASAAASSRRSPVGFSRPYVCGLTTRISVCPVSRGCAGSAGAAPQA